MKSKEERIAEVERAIKRCRKCTHVTISMDGREKSGVSPCDTHGKEMERAIEAKMEGEPIPEFIYVSVEEEDKE